MKILVKRVYDAPAKSDGMRVLVDRLWPRGVKKTDAAIDVWAKEIAPSSALRRWFHADPESRYKEFTRKYRKELSGQKAAGREILKAGKRITLITAVRDIDRSHIPTLVAFLAKL